MDTERLKKTNQYRLFESDFDRETNKYLHNSEK